MALGRLRGPGLCSSPSPEREDMRMEEGVPLERIFRLGPQEFQDSSQSVCLSSSEHGFEDCEIMTRPGVARVADTVLGFLFILFFF